MKLISPILSWIYLKNWQFDQMREDKRTFVFFGSIISLMIFSGTIPAIFAIIGKSSWGMLGHLMTVLFMIGLALFRIPYSSGQLNNFEPQFLRQKREERKKQSQKKSSSYYIDEPQSQRLHYLRILGLGANASDDDIKKAYRKLAMKWHPDRHSGEQAKKAEESFKIIKQAYERLSS